MAGPVVLLLHIPKTAGTTLASVVYAQFDQGEAGYATRPQRWIEQGAYQYYDVLLLAENGVAGFFRNEGVAPTAQTLELLRRPEVKVIMGHLWFGIHGYLERPFTYITMLRDPVSRVISLYSHLWQYQSDSPAWGQLVPDAPSIEQFVREGACKEVDNDQTRRISGEDPPFGCSTREMLDLAKQNLREHFSVVGITERFDESLLLIMRTLGWDRISAYLPRLVNPSRPPRTDLSPQAVAAITEYNQLDIELYDDACGLLDDAIARDADLPELVEAFRAGNEGFIAQHRWW